jgi:hypothetical protein
MTTRRSSKSKKSPPDPEISSDEEKTTPQKLTRQAYRTFNGTQEQERNMLLTALCSELRSNTTKYIKHTLQPQQGNRILRLIFIWFIWIAGTRMIWQGTDGLSWGDLTAGVMAGEHFLKYVPLNRTAFQRHILLHEWISGALPGENWEGLSVEGWFTNAQKDGRFVWAPPPALADVDLCSTSNFG